MVLTTHPTIAAIYPIKRKATLIQIINYRAASAATVQSHDSPYAM